MSELSQAALDRILGWLDADRKLALEKFLGVRTRLLAFFLREVTVPEVANELSNRTLIRMARLGEFEPPENVADFIDTVSQSILEEHKETERGKSSQGTAPAEFKEGVRGATESFRDPIPFEDFRLIGSEKPSKRRKLRPLTKTERDAPSVRKRIVSSGFSTLAQPDEPVNKQVSLTAGKSYYFWFHIGSPQKGSIETKPTALPDVPAFANLTVVLCAFKDSLQLEQGGEIGHLQVQDDGLIRVTQQPHREPVSNSEMLRERLFFLVRTPEKAGMFRMRCNVYLGQTLLQSRIIEARVTSLLSEKSKQAVLTSVLDYKISQQFNPAHLNSLSDHRLSILLNRNEDGTHSFHFYGAESFKQDDVRFDPGELDGMIAQARGTLRLASWGDDQEWRAGLAYKYKDRKPDLDRLKADLINLARWGYEFYTQIRDRLAAGEDAVDRFERILRQPGSIQFAMKESPRYILPAAIIYDQPLDTGAEDYSLCERFVAAFQQAETLENLPCLLGDCPSREDITTVCPSGFWGFRHYIGMPLSIKNAPDAPTEILVNGDLKMAAGVATDLELLKPHSAEMKKLRSRLSWQDADHRDRVFTLLKGSPHLVYFYCHGGLVRNMPFLQLGPKENPSLIQRSNIFAHRIKWEEPRPLVFINGCHTTAVAPTQALEFITPLVTYAKAAGVIGTEITIFEQLATVFAEDCLGRFVKGEPIGKAVRNARLKLLKEGNPLGLVYIPFVMSGLRMVDKT